MEDIKIIKDYEEAMANGSLPEMPEALDEKCRELIEEAFIQLPCRSASKHIRASFARAAVVVLLLFGLSTVMVLSVDAFRVPVLTFLLNQREKYVSINSEQIIKPESSTSDKVIRRVNEYIPVGYELISCVSGDAQYSVAYQNPDKHVIYFTCAEENCNIHIDTEDTSYHALDFGDYTAVFSKKDGYMLIWIDDQADAVYTLFADGMTEEVFLEFAYFLIS